MKERAKRKEKEAQKKQESPKEVVQTDIQELPQEVATNEKKVLPEEEKKEICVEGRDMEKASNKAEDMENALRRSIE